MPHLTGRINLKVAIVPSPDESSAPFEFPMTINTLARALADARLSRRPHAFSPKQAPADTADAYRIQAEVAQVLGTGAAGWKTGFAPTPERTPMAGPIFACDMVKNGGSYALAAGEEVKVEVELAIRLGRDLPPGPTYSVADILAATAEMLVGIELVGTRYAEPDAAPFAARLADNFNNAFYVTGEGRTDFAALARVGLPCRLWIDGTLVADHPGVHPDGDPLAPVAAWACAQADRLGGLRAGQIITTGSLNQPVPLSGPARIEAELEGLGRVRLSLM